jgi:hypothetical protein
MFWQLRPSNTVESTIKATAVNRTIFAFRPKLKLISSGYVQRQWQCVVVTLMTHLVTLPTKSVYCFVGRSRSDKCHLLFLHLGELVYLHLGHHVIMGFSYFFANSCLDSRCFMLVTSVLWAQYVNTKPCEVSTGACWVGRGLWKKSSPLCNYLISYIFRTTMLYTYYITQLVA